MATRAEVWFETMREIWANKQPDRMAEILANDLKFYEVPGQEPYTSVPKVVGLWQEILDQEIEVLEFEMLYTTDTVGMAVWRFKQVGEKLHEGSYFLELDENGKCTHFRQWWHEVGSTNGL